MEIIFVIYEWCFALLGIALHLKIRVRWSFFLCTGMTLTAVLVALRFIGESFLINNLFFSTLVPGILLVVPIMTLSAFAMIVINWKKIVNISR